MAEQQPNVHSDRSAALTPDQRKKDVVEPIPMVDRSKMHKHNDS